MAWILIRQRNSKLRNMGVVWQLVSATDYHMVGKLLELTCASIWTRFVLKSVGHLPLLTFWTSGLYNKHTHRSLLQSWGCWLPGKSLHLHSHVWHWFPKTGMNAEHRGRESEIKVIKAVKLLERVPYCITNKRKSPNLNKNMFKRGKKWQSSLTQAILCFYSTCIYVGI